MHMAQLSFCLPFSVSCNDCRFELNFIEIAVRSAHFNGSFNHATVNINHEDATFDSLATKDSGEVCE